MNRMEEKIVILSKAESISEVEKYIEEICSKYNVDDAIFGNILVSITEAVNNAIIHGNKNDLSKFVSVSHKIKEDQKLLSITVTDEGKGFNYNNLPDPTSPENISMIGGRGVFLIKNLADYVIFSDKGNSIELDFRI